MTVFDAHANLAVATVSPDSTVIGSTLGDTLIAESVEAAALFPAVPFNVTVSRDAAPEPGAAEIMRATAFDGVRTFTVVRGEQGTTAQAFISQGWKFGNTITVADIVAIEDAVTGGEAGLAAETAARESADTALQGGISAEATARAAGDAATLSGAEAYADGKVSAEASARAAGDAATLAAAEGYSDSHVAAEAAARVAGDAATLASAEGYADGEVAAEAAARASADSTLQTHIDAEAAARASGDATTLTTAEGYADGKVDTEATARAAGDAATLSSAEGYTDAQVAAEAALRASGDAATLSSAEAYADSKSSITAATAVKTGAYTASGGQLVPVDTTAGAVTITLPAAVAGGRPIVVKHVIQGGLNVVTVAASGTDVFDKVGGAATLSLALADQAVMLYPGAGIWYVEADQGFVNLVLPSRVKGYIYAPSTGDSTVDGAELSNALNLLPLTGGEMRLDVGPYDATAGVNVNKPVRIVGMGSNGASIASDGSFYLGSGSLITCNSRTAIPFAVNADGVSFERIAVKNVASLAPTAGAGIQVQTYGKALRYIDCVFSGFYINVDILNGAQWYVDRCIFIDPVLAGLSIQDADKPDSSAAAISDSFFLAGPTHLTPDSGILWKSGGGVRLSNSKISIRAGNGFTYGLRMSVLDAVTTAILVMTGNSIEDVQNAVRIEQAGTTGQFSIMVITGNHLKGNRLGGGGNALSLSGASTLKIQYCVCQGNVLDANPAISLNNINGFRLGINEYATSGSQLAMTGSNTRIWLEDIVSTTANRPLASAMRGGSRYYDTTLNKPGIADGSGNWRDFVGNII